ncbi:MAG: hypothetical protein ABI782_03950 [Anaerolineaceae bacterium]
MKRLSLLSAALLAGSVFALLLAAPAFALEGSPTGGNGRDILPPVVWMLCGVAGSVLMLSIFYLLKRRVGGFPANPAWVAPITIMPSSELPQDGAAPEHSATEDHYAPTH